MRKWKQASVETNNGDTEKGIAHKALSRYIPLFFMFQWNS